MKLGARRWFAALSLLAVFAATAVGITLWQVVELSSLATVSEQVERTKPLTSHVRIGLIGLLIVCWVGPSFAHRHAASAIAQARWRVVGWIVVIELMIGQNLMGRFAGVLVT